MAENTIPAPPGAGSLLGNLGGGTSIPYGQSEFFQTGAFEGRRKMEHILDERREAALRRYALTEVAKEYEKQEGLRSKAHKLSELTTDSAIKDIKYKERVRPRVEQAGEVTARETFRQALSAVEVAAMQDAARLAAPLLNIPKDAPQEDAERAYAAVRNSMRKSGINPSAYGFGNPVWSDKVRQSAAVLNEQAIATPEHLREVDLKLLEARKMFELEMLRNSGAPLESLSGEPLLLEYLRRQNPAAYRSYVDDKYLKLPAPGETEWGNLETEMFNRVQNVFFEFLATSSVPEHMDFVREYTKLRAEGDEGRRNMAQQRFDDIVKKVASDVVPLYSSMVSSEKYTKQEAWQRVSGRIEERLLSGELTLQLNPEPLDRTPGTWGGTTERVPVITETPGGAPVPRAGSPEIIQFDER